MRVGRAASVTSPLAAWIVTGKPSARGAPAAWLRVTAPAAASTDTKMRERRSTSNPPSARGSGFAASDRSSDSGRPPPPSSQASRPSDVWWRSVSPYSGGTVPALHRSSLTARRFEGASLASAAMRPLALDLDAVLADTRPLWNDWVEDAGRRAHVELELPDDRVDAASVLDERLGDWRPLLERFAADRGPVHFRPHGDTGALLRRLHAAGARIGVFTDAPRELADVALAHVGAARRVETVGTYADVLAALGGDATVVHTREELGSAAADYHSEHAGS